MTRDEEALIVKKFVHEHDILVEGIRQRCSPDDFFCILSTAYAICLSEFAGSIINDDEPHVKLELIDVIAHQAKSLLTLKIDAIRKDIKKQFDS